MSKVIRVSDEAQCKLKDLAEHQGIPLAEIFSSILQKAGLRVIKDQYVSLLIDNDAAFYTKVPRPVVQRFEGAGLTLQKSVLPDGKKVIIVTELLEGSHPDLRSGYMEFSRRSEVSFPYEAAEWLGIGEGEKIMWRIGKQVTIEAADRENHKHGFKD